MPKIIEITTLRLLELTLNCTYDCLILKYAEEDAHGHAVMFNKAIFFEEFPQGRGPHENWCLMETGHAEAIRSIATTLMRKLEKEILEQE